MGGLKENVGSEEEWEEDDDDEDGEVDIVEILQNRSK